MTLLQTILRLATAAMLIYLAVRVRNQENDTIETDKQ